MLLWLFQLLFGCHHNHLSRVFTIKNRMYQVCVECGREIDYSWESMRSVQPKVVQDAYAPLKSVGRTRVSVS